MYELHTMVQLVHLLPKSSGVSDAPNLRPLRLIFWGKLTKKLATSREGGNIIMGTCQAAADEGDVDVHVHRTS